MGSLLSAEDIRVALDALAAKLEAAGLQRELVLVGGAALVLGYGAARSTRDVDACPLDDPIRAAARAVAGELGLPSSWLSDDARAFMRGISAGKVVFERPALVARCASTEQLLAMKVCAARDEADWEDARLLLSAMGSDRDQVRLQIEPHLVAGKQKRGLENFEDLWEELHGHR